MVRRCCICLKLDCRSTKKDRRSFFRLPQFNTLTNSSEKEVLKRRRDEWLKVVRSNESRLFVCSEHFVSGNYYYYKLLISSEGKQIYVFVGKPSFLHNTEDIDWVPTKNMECLGLNVTRPSD